MKVTKINKMGGGKPPRQSNFELLRIIAMLMVLVIHADFLALGSPSDAEIMDHPISSAVRYVVESLGLVCVNLYILISGYFGIKVKMRSVLNFAFLVIFWRIVITPVVYIVRLVLGLGLPLTPYEMFMYFIPGFGDWFALAYVLLLFVAPMLNSWLDRVSTLRLTSYLVGFYLFIMLFNWILEIPAQISRGYSSIWFIWLYLAGALMRRLSISFRRSPRHYLMLYLAVSVCAGLGFFIIRCCLIGEDTLWVRRSLVSYVSPFVVVASLLLFACFDKLKFNSAIINKIAVSTFAVYLVHMHPLIAGGYLKACQWIYDRFNTWQYIPLIVIFILGVFFVIVAGDRIRLILWNYISDRFLLPVSGRLSAKFSDMLRLRMADTKV